MKALETLARCGLRGWCGRTARAAGAGTRLPRRERAHAAGLPTGRGRMARRYAPPPAASRVSCIPVAQSFALPCLSQISAFCALAARSPCICSHLRVALRCAQQPTGLTLPCAPTGARNAHCSCAAAQGLGRCPKLRQTRREACALWALATGGGKATRSGAAKRAAGAASARRDIEQPMIPLHPALSHSSSVTPRSPPYSPPQAPPPSPRRPSAPSPAAGPYPAYPARALPAP